MKLLLALTLSFFLGSVYAEQPAPLPLTECTAQAPFGFPRTKKLDVQAICRTGYLALHDNKAKIPAYVSYVLKPENAVGCAERDSSFSPDRSLPPGMRAETKDYAKSGYDIGHLANAADLRYSILAQSTAAILSNAAPQLAAFNRGIWLKLESATRGWAISRDSSLLIYVGPIYNVKQDPTIGKGMVTVPHAFFKIITDLKTHEVLVFIFKHEGSSNELKVFITSFAEVQKQTGIVFPLPKNPVFTEIWPIELKTVREARAEACSK
jgi:DNA/RNA endonuclease G (NUC1)